MANLLVQWGPTILKNMPYILGTAAQLYSMYQTTSASNEEKKAVSEAMKLIEQNRSDIDRLVEGLKLKEQSRGDTDMLMEDRRQMMAMLQGLAVLMERLTQHYGSPHFPPSHSCQHAMEPPCCHHQNRSRGPPGCHHHHGPRGPSGCHDHGPAGPFHPGRHHKGPKKPPCSPCTAHKEMLQCQDKLWQELSDDEDYRGTAYDSSSNGGSWRVCDVCRNNYNTTNRRPTILECGHTFCRECIGQVASRGPLLCPTCRTHERRPSAALPPNVVLMIALEEEGQRENRTENNRDEDDWKKNSIFLQEEEELMMQRALHRSMKKNRAESNWDEDDWKNSTLLQEEEEVLTQMALHLSMENGAGNVKNKDDWKNSTLLQEEEEVLTQMALQLSLESEVGCSATAGSKHDSKDSGNLQTMKIKDSCIKIEEHIKDEVLPKAGSISLGLVDAQQCRKALMGLKRELMTANERLMCHLEQLDGITFQDTDTQNRQSRKILVKKIQNLMDQYDRMQENVNQLMLNHR